MFFNPTDFLAILSLSKKNPMEQDIQIPTSVAGNFLSLSHYPRCQWKSTPTLCRSMERPANSPRNPTGNEAMHQSTSEHRLCRTLNGPTGDPFGTTIEWSPSRASLKSLKLRKKKVITKKNSWKKIFIKKW